MVKSDLEKALTVSKIQIMFGNRFLKPDQAYQQALGELEDMISIAPLGASSWIAENAARYDHLYPPKT